MLYGDRSDVPGDYSELMAKSVFCLHLPGGVGLTAQHAHPGYTRCRKLWGRWQKLHRTYQLSSGPSRPY